MSAAPDRTDAGGAWAAAQLAAALFAIDPRLGGVRLRAAHGPVRDAWLESLSGLFPAAERLRRAPAAIDAGRLLGAIDLAATLRAGRPVIEAGLLEQADGGVILFPMAERMSAATAAQIAAAMDEGVVRMERDGASRTAPVSFGVVAFDEGLGDDESPPAALLDRLAFHVDLETCQHRDATPGPYTAEDVACARARLDTVEDDAALVETLVCAAARFGIASLRAVAMAVRAARAACALRGATRMEAQDVACAASAILASRATRAPADAEAEPPAQDAAEPPDPGDDSSGAADDRDGGRQDEKAPDELDACVLEAVRAALPQGLLESLGAGLSPRARHDGAGRSGAARINGRRGRPLGARPGGLREGRLSVVATLCAAAPWQRLRRAAAGPCAQDRRIVVLPADFRIQRLSQMRETVAIFVVDASGSSAIQRLAEVKGAIELFLAECYVRRDHVALVAFRGKGAETLLHPTRSLARARRELTGLPGGGGTPLACGLDMALSLADAVRRKGQSPLLVLMTDGRANVTREGAPGRIRAMEDALDAARAIGCSGCAALAIDTSSSLQKDNDAPTLRIASAMNARYLNLPYVEASKVSRAVSAASAHGAG